MKHDRIIAVNNHHGTRCAGEIAAVKNSYCAVGVAYEARIAGIVFVFIYVL